MHLLSYIGEHKADTATAAAGTGLGVFVGNEVYKHTPHKMARRVYSGVKYKNSITDNYINYVTKVQEKDLFTTIDPHTERTWLNHEIQNIRKVAANAKLKPDSDARWDFQKMYDLGIQYLTNRKEVPEESIALAKKGANAIEYGRMIEKRNKMVVCGALFGLGALAIKKSIEAYKKFKNIENETK